jgi:hypothetical protein
MSFFRLRHESLSAQHDALWLFIGQKEKVVNLAAQKLRAANGMDFECAKARAHAHPRVPPAQGDRLVESRGPVAQAVLVDAQSLESPEAYEFYKANQSAMLRALQDELAAAKQRETVLYEAIREVLFSWDAWEALADLRLEDVPRFEDAQIQRLVDFVCKLSGRRVRYLRRFQSCSSLFSESCARTGASRPASGRRDASRNGAVTCAPSRGHVRQGFEAPPALQAEPPTRKRRRAATARLSDDESESEEEEEEVEEKVRHFDRGSADHEVVEDEEEEEEEFYDEEEAWAGELEPPTRVRSFCRTVCVGAFPNEQMALVQKELAVRHEIPNWLQSLFMFMVEKQKRIGMFSLGAGIERFLAVRKEKNVKKARGARAPPRVAAFFTSRIGPAGDAHSRRQLLVDIAHLGTEASAFLLALFWYFVLVLNSHRPRRACSFSADAANSSASQASMLSRRKTEKFMPIRWRTTSAASLRNSPDEARLA